jgi:light-regulated signal transduction histidine kinase (bacteriophytochrome)
LEFVAQTTPPRIEISAQNQGNKTILTIRDNGIGFDMTLHDRMFTVFNRRHLAVDCLFADIGLVRVERTMRRMSAQIWAESRPGTGAIFFPEVPS